MVEAEIAEETQTHEFGPARTSSGPARRRIDALCAAVVSHPGGRRAGRFSQAGRAAVPCPTNPAAWLFRVVRNGAIDAGKAERRRSRHETTAASRTDAWFEADPSGGPDTIDPDQAASELKTLPLAEREVIIAHLWGGLTFEQVATVAGCSSSAAHRLYSRGLSTLRERLGVSCRKSRSIPN